MLTKEQFKEIDEKKERIIEIIESLDFRMRELLWEALWGEFCKYCGVKLNGHKCYCVWDD